MAPHSCNAVAIPEKLLHQYVWLDGRSITGAQRTVCFWTIGGESRRDMHILTAAQPSGPVRVSIDGYGAYSTYHAASNSKHNRVFRRRAYCLADRDRPAQPQWFVSAGELEELAENARSLACTRNLIVKDAEWQTILCDWQYLDLSPRLKTELRILKETLTRRWAKPRCCSGVKSFEGDWRRPTIRTTRRKNCRSSRTVGPSAMQMGRRSPRPGRGRRYPIPSR